MLNISTPNTYLIFLRVCKVCMPNPSHSNPLSPIFGYIVHIFIIYHVHSYWSERSFKNQAVPSQFESSQNAMTKIKKNEAKITYLP